MKAAGLKIRDMGGVLNVSAIITLIMVNTKMVKSMGEAFTNGWTVISTKVNGWMGRNTAMVIGRISKKIHILGVGSIIWPMGSEYTSGQMETGMKASGKNH